MINFVTQFVKKIDKMNKMIHFDNPYTCPKAQNERNEQNDSFC